MPQQAAHPVVDIRQPTTFLRPAGIGRWVGFGARLVDVCRDVSSCLILYTIISKFVADCLSPATYWIIPPSIDDTKQKQYH